MKTIKIQVINTEEPAEDITKSFTDENIPDDLDIVIVKHVGGRPNDRK